jgi:nucleoside-diphosphate-sugar epimerase
MPAFYSTHISVILPVLELDCRKEYILKSKVFVTGGTGFVGGALCRLLVERGYHVTALVRSLEKATWLVKLGVQIVEGDLRDRKSFQNSLENQDTVYHIAAAYREARLSDKSYWATNVEGTRNIVNAAAEANVGRFVHCSSGTVHGNTGRTPANENSPYHLPDFYSRSKLEGELAARELFEKLNFPGVVFRPTGIHGPGDLRFLKLFRSINNRTFFMIGDGETVYHLTYIDDLCNGILLCGEKDEALGNVFILGGERFISLNTFVVEIAKILDVAPRHFHIPVGPVMASAVVCEKLCRPLGLEPPLYPRRVEFFTKDRAFDISKARRILGYQPEVSLVEGLRRTADWYRAEGLLA